MLRYKTETRPGLVALYNIGQETEQVNSYNPGACTGPPIPVILYTGKVDTTKMKETNKLLFAYLLTTGQVIRC